MKPFKLIFYLFIIKLLTGCQTIKHDLPVVKSIDLNKYAGKWYEIARLPNKFEEGLECVTANYTLLENGKVEVLNQGHLVTNHSKIKSAKGKAYIPDKTESGKLKVTFFWPFYGDYWIIDLGEDYEFALVGDPSRKYLWILCRQKKIDEKNYLRLLESAKMNGFDISKIQKIDQSCEN
jgi:apolipoprotein D and lipocalin family protein